MPKPDWPTAAAFLPEERSLGALRSAAAGCQGCPLWEPATQTVFGRGTESARLALVGEQPGDQEDQQGKPFVGPAALARIHPSAVLRADDRDAALARLVSDLRVVAKQLA